jgi:hypothetical protein
VIEDNEPARIPSAGKTDTTPPRIPAPDMPEAKGTAEQQFLRLVGDSAAGRKLFADIMEDDQRARTVERAVADPSEAVRQYVTHVQCLERAGEQLYARYAGRLADTDEWERYRDVCRRVVPPGYLSAVLFLGALADLPADADPGDVDHVLRATFIDLSGSVEKDEFRKLFAAWLARRRNPKAVQAGLEAALYAAIPDAVKTARKVAADPKAPPGPAAAALTVLGHYGGHEDLSLLSRWRDEARPVAGGPAGDGAMYVAPVRDWAQVRDVAAAMSLRLRGRGPEEFGFPMACWVGHWFGPDRPPFETIRDVVPAAVREWAQTRAWEWLDKQPGAPPKPGK